jgi:hypothetical protein
MATRENIQAFLSRSGEAAPRFTPNGIGYQLNWKTRLFGALPYEDDAGRIVGYIESGWTRYLVTGRTKESCVSKALAKEWHDSSVNFVQDDQASPDREDEDE